MLYGFIGAFFTFICIDAIWLLLIARKFYRKEMGGLLRDNPNMLCIVLFYVCYNAILVYMGVLPHLAAHDIIPVIIHCGLLGLLAYGTYDITNYALLRNWSLKMTIVDTLWGISISILSGLGGYFALLIVL
ncbi:MAG: DUF2177 family protein [Alphaproteobacteria bacterium]|nr:MAG: DUF2177 family protein [Alphaproteobacteria bacterium]